MTDAPEYPGPLRAGTDAGTDASSEAGAAETPPAAGNARVASPQRRWFSRVRLGDPVALVLAALFFVLATLVSWAQWRRMEVPSWDLGIFTQLLKAYGNLGAPIVPIKGEGFNLLGDHFHPILVVLGPVYALFPSAFTLLVVQNLLFAASVFVVARLASDRLGTFPGRLIGLAYALCWGVQSAVSSQFHEIAFAVPMIAIALAALIEERWRTAVVAAGLLVFVKEDLGATVFVFGLVYAWRARRRGGRFSLRDLNLTGVGLALWGLAWMFLATVVILPALNPGGQFDYSDRLELRALLANPVQGVVLFFFPSVKTATMLTLLFTGALVWIRSPLALLVLPTLLWRFWSNLEFYWTTDWHYSAVLMPIVFIALIDVLDRWAAKRRAASESRKARGSRGAPGLWRPEWAVGLAAVATVVVALILMPGRPFATLTDETTFAASPRTQAAEEVEAAIPRGSTVLTDLGLMARLVPDTTVYWVGSPGNPATDYVLVDRENSAWGGGAPGDAAAYAEQAFPGTSYENVLDTGDYQLARRQ